MLTFLGTEPALDGQRRRYEHPDLGILRVLTTHGPGGSADVVWLYGAMWEARCRRGDVQRAQVLSVGSMGKKSRRPQIEAQE
jgi:hypothetical protein